jgi:translation initiation factor 2 subunit 1
MHKFKNDFNKIRIIKIIFNMSQQQLCRMYENDLPSINDIVAVKVKEITDTMVYVSLLEYNNIEGVIQLSELSKKRFRSINKIIQVNNIEYVCIIDIDGKKNISLSKRRVCPEEVKEAENKWNQSKIVHSIIQNVSITENVDMEILYDMFCWKLYKIYNHAYNAFELVMNGKENILEEFSIPDGTLKKLLIVVQQKFPRKVYKVQTIINIFCFTENGSDKIKRALTCAEECPDVEISLIASPEWCITTTCFDIEEGMERLKNICTTISEDIVKNEGFFEYKTKPAAIED